MHACLSALQVADGYKVIAGCLATSEALTALGDAVAIVEGSELTTEEGIEKLRAGAVEVMGEGGKLDLFVSNAGVLTFEDVDDFKTAKGREGCIDMMKVDAIGPLHLAAVMAPLVKDGGKMSFMSSAPASMTVAASGAMPGLAAYRMAKAALNIGVCIFAQGLKARGVAVNLLHPGMVDTEMTKDFPPGMEKITTTVAAEGLLKQIDALTIETTCSFTDATNSTTVPW